MHICFLLNSKPLLFAFMQHLWRHCKRHATHEPALSSVCCSAGLCSRANAGHCSTARGPGGQGACVRVCVCVCVCVKIYLFAVFRCVWFHSISFSPLHPLHTHTHTHTHTLSLSLSLSLSFCSKSTHHLSAAHRPARKQRPAIRIHALGSRCGAVHTVENDRVALAIFHDDWLGAAMSDSQG